jgi:hypothetical protein
MPSFSREWCRRIAAAFALGAALAPISAQTPVVPPSGHLWKPAADKVYLQEVGEKIPTGSPITEVALLDGTLYGVIEGEAHRLASGVFTKVPNAPHGVTRLKALGGALWMAADGGTYRSDGAQFQRTSEHPMVDFCLHLGSVYAATRDAIYRFESGGFVDIRPKTGYLSNDTTVMMADGSQVLVDPVEIASIWRIGSYSGTLYMLRDHGLALLDGDTFVTDPIDWGALPSRTVRDMLVLGSRVYVTTDRGVGVLRGMAMTALRGADGLPYEDTTCLAPGFDGDLWIGTTTGAIRKTEQGYHYFGAQHWLPGDHVNGIATGDRVVYIATDAGLGIIRYEPYTLAKKAAYFERSLDEWGHKRLGFIHQIYWSGKDNEWLREISDNDGGHTAHYLAAMSFKYAATGDPSARREAENAFQAMSWLESITGSDGFFARSIWAINADQGEPSRFGSGGLPAKWYTTKDGRWMWKGDTSSDEVNGHFYSVSVFHDLVADDAEKRQSARHLARIAGHIMSNGWVLRDMDGQPTRWGRWDPEYLQRPYGFEARGLNSLEAQTYVWTALALSGDEKFRAGLKQLADWGYPAYTLRQKLTFPPESVITWDDELSFRCYHAILRYADDPKLRAIYLRGLERSWEVMRMQKIPFFNFVYGALTGNDCEVGPAVQHLREWSLDTINHSFHNSHRADLAPEPGYAPIVGDKRAISPRESTAMWGSRTAIEYDGGNGGRTVTPPIGWLEDYWMGRYYGFIQAPDSKDPALTTLPDAPLVHRGAKPYGGPPRPGRFLER